MEEGNEAEEDVEGAGGWPAAVEEEVVAGAAAAAAEEEDEDEEGEGGEEVEAEMEAGPKDDDRLDIFFTLLTPVSTGLSGSDPTWDRRTGG